MNQKTFLFQAKFFCNKSTTDFQDSLLLPLFPLWQKKTHFFEAKINVRM